MPGTVFVRLCLVLVTFGAKLFRLTLLAEEFTGYLTNSDDRMVFILRMSNKVLMLLVRFCCVRVVSAAEFFQKKILSGL